MPPPPSPQNSSEITFLTPQAGLGPLLYPLNPSTGGAGFVISSPRKPGGSLETVACIYFQVITRGWGVEGRGREGILLEQGFLTLAVR